MGFCPQNPPPTAENLRESGKFGGLPLVLDDDGDGDDDDVGTTQQQND